MRKPEGRMNRVKIIPALLLAATLAACDRSDTGSGDGATPAAAPDSPVVAEVNGEPVREAVLDAYLRARGMSDSSQGQRRQALQEVVNLVLLRQRAEKQGLDEDPQVRADLALHRLSTLATRQVRSHNAENPVTEADARAEYDRSRQTAGTKEYHVRHILLDSRQAAEKAIVELNKGADFADLADERSLDKREEAGGDLGWLNLAQLPEPLREPVRQLNTGAHGQKPIQTRFGWHVLKLVETRKLDPPGFDQVKQGVIASLQRQRMEEYVQELRAKADIKMTPEMARTRPAGDADAAPAARPDSADGSAGAEEDQGG